MERITAIIVAAGKGLRMGGNIPKQYMELDGIPILARTLLKFEESPADEVIVVCPQGDVEYVREHIILKYGIKKCTAVVEGGDERFDSCRKGLEAVSPRTGLVLIHDGVRPLVTPGLIGRVIEYTGKYKACCPGIVPRDTVRLADSNSFSCASPLRNDCRLIQTPQGFEVSLLRTAYERFFAGDEEARREAGITDDAMLVERFCGQKIYLCEGEDTNIKLTRPEDPVTARYILGNLS